MLPERLSRGNAGTFREQPIDGAAWVWHQDSAAEFVRFRCPFRAETEATLTLDASADERFVLFLDGEEVGRGPHAGMPERWFYATWEMDVAAGDHLLEAVAWHVGGGGAPIAQLSWKPGFVLNARGEFDAALTTGRGPWTAARLCGTALLNRWWWTGGAVECRGTGFLEERPDEAAYSPAQMVRGPLPEGRRTGGRADGWLLFPSVLPDQRRRPCAPGEFVGERHAEMCALLAGGPPVLFPPRSRVRLLWDLGDYFCAYPRLETAGGAGAEVRWDWFESLVGPDGKKGDRDEWNGKQPPKDARGLMVCRPDGRRRAVFESPWWRSGRWCQLDVSTADDPLEITSVRIFETGYPMEDAGRFESDDPTLEDVRKLCLRGLRSCMHETFIDCPYWERQNYPGDMRVEMLAAFATGRDARLARHCLALFDCARRDDGMLPMNWPTRCLQESSTYTLLWPLMLADFAMWRDDVDWLRFRIPGLRHTMAGFLAYENADGLLAGLSGWCFMDWVPEWPRGVPPDGEDAERPNALNNLLYLGALRSAALVERIAGSEAVAEDCEARAARLAGAIFRAFWREKRGLLADTIHGNAFSEHAQCLALLFGALPEEKRAPCFRSLVEAPDLARATIYFSHYLFETFFAFGRADLFLKRLDHWRGYVRAGLKTPPESPGDTPRSDCHGWGTHPLFHFHAGLAGVRPDAPGFRRVRVAPCPGPLRRIRTTTPHPAGCVKCDLLFKSHSPEGTVTLPEGVEGVFVWNGRETPLVPGRNTLTKGIQR